MPTVVAMPSRLQRWIDSLTSPIAFITWISRG
jgi:hypothetical protein